MPVLAGLPLVEATQLAEALGCFVRKVYVGSDVALTADMRTDRVTLFIEGQDVVKDAMVG